ncbi:hypothetical protein C0Q70_11195 [Pomacea canaliculata]|uniref:Pectin acetylesterase n=1 Tax=Pomacea canaliculata TaxID=400727 RepID=A0A2T7P595_POMCA|nr:hypothetical protein C0Q70_11195 [Pomacea canaliculata]
MDSKYQHQHHGVKRALHVLRVMYMLTLCILTPRPSTAQRGRGDASDVTLGTQRLGRMDSKAQVLLQEMTSPTRACGETDMALMRRKRLRHPSITCNDGSSAGYYIRKSRGSSKWIVFLEGGWFCFDRASCIERRLMMPDYMSSLKWPRHRKGTGILSWDPQENPHYFHSNMVAGGTGVLVNIDHIAEIVRSRAPQVEVRGLVDAGWFLDKDPAQGHVCLSAHSCPALVSIQRGIKMWEPRLPKDCQAKYPTEIWRCYFGHRFYHMLKTPVYIIQNLYDAAQIKVDNILDENNGGDFNAKWQYLLKLGEEVKATLENASAVFAPACISHDVLLNSKWHKLSIDGVTLSQSIYCWEENGAFTFSNCQHANIAGVQNNRLQTSGTSRNDTPLADSPPAGESKKKGKKKNRKKMNRKNWRRNKNQGHSSDTDRSRREAERGSRCKKHLLDRCPWPHCNCSCLRCCWPDTMNEVNQYFMKNLASAMDIDPVKMQNMHLCGY